MQHSHAGRPKHNWCACRSYFPLTRTRTLQLCEQLRLRGPGAIDAQHAMERLALDVIMKAGFDLNHHSVDFSECEILDSIHYCFNEIFRCVLHVFVIGSGTR